MRSLARLGVAALALAAVAACQPQGAGGSGGGQVAQAPLIARDALFGNPQRAQARISPDGAYISYLAPLNGYLNVFVAPVDDLAAAKPITNDSARGIRQHFWAPNATHVLYLQDKGGDENWRLYSVEIASGTERDLTPIEGVQAQVVHMSRREPNAVLVGLNDRDPRWHDVYKIDVTSGRRALIERNTENFAGFVADEDNILRLATKALPSGALEVWAFNLSGGWVKSSEIPFEDSLTTFPIGFEADGKSFLMLDSTGRDKAALVRVDAVSAKKEVLGESPRADVSEVWIDPQTKTAEAFAAEYLKREWTPLAEDAKAAIEFLDANLDGEPTVVSRTDDDQRWIVQEVGSRNPGAAYLFDRRANALTKLFDLRPDLTGAPLAAMLPLEITARDGLPLVSYLTLPPGSDADGNGRPDAPLPLVLNVHGGPWARDAYGFHPEHQWLANRGYAALSVNFRGSTGFGKAFVNAGNKEWAGKMHDDLIDALEWAVREGVTTADKAAIYGGSYGGYATLVGLTFTPERFACGVSIVGPSNLETLLASIPPYWESFRTEFALRVGDPQTPEGRALLAERSPLTKAASIRRPLLIAQGANDPRVKQAESDQIVAAMKANALPVTYVIYSDEGHGFARPQNRLSFYAISEGFLSGCLGGRAEPIGDDLTGASLSVPEGAALIPGLEAALTPPALP